MAEQQGAAGVRQVVELMSGYMASASLRAGLDLKVFTHIARGAATAGELAAAIDAPERSMRILCDALFSFRLLDKSDGRYSLPEGSGMLLSEDSPFYIGDFARITINPLIWAEAIRLADIVKAGHSLMERDAEAKDHPFWHEFSRSSNRVATFIAPAVVNLVADLKEGWAPRKILDIACGSGIYGFTALQRFGEARLASVDWPGVLALAEPVAISMGVRDRTEFRPGDIFSSDLGSGYDLILAVNIFHHFNMERNGALSRKLYEAAAPGGALVVVDFIPDDRRERRGNPLVFALSMLVWTQNGDSYTFDEYGKMLASAGFKDAALKEIQGIIPVQAVVARK